MRMIRALGLLMKVECLSWHNLPPDREMVPLYTYMFWWLIPLSVCVSVCVWEQEAASVAAEAASLANAVSSPAPDSERDETKETEAEETVSHSWSCQSPKFCSHARYSRSHWPDSVQHIGCSFSQVSFSDITERVLVPFHQCFNTTPVIFYIYIYKYV